MRKAILAASAVIALAGASAAQAVVANFDDLGNSSFQVMPVGYQGFTWTNFGVINGPAYGASGYANGVVSGENVACACAADFGETINTLTAGGAAFTLNSGYFTSAWNDGATLLVEGLSSGNVLFSDTFLLDTGGPSFLNFNWGGIDELQFSISGGSPSGLPGVGDYFGVDDLSITIGGTGAIPEPSSWAMLIAGFGLSGAAMRRRRMAAVA